MVCQLKGNDVIVRFYQDVFYESFRFVTRHSSVLFLKVNRCGTDASTILAPVYSFEKKRISVRLSDPPRGLLQESSIPRGEVCKSDSSEFTVGGEVLRCALR